MTWLSTPGPADEVATAAVAMIVSRSGPESVLLMQRSTHPDDPWSGHWAFPGGRVETTDRDLVHTAQRELAEEVGLDLGDLTPDEVIHPCFAGRHVGRPILVAPFVWYVDGQPELRLEASEVAQVHWCPLLDLAEPHAHPTAALAQGRPTEQFPYVNVNGTPLWGFTYGVLVDWLRRRSEPPLGG